MKGHFKTIIISLVIIALIIGIAGYLILAPKSATPAVLYIEKGTVEVDMGSGWQQAIDEMSLSQNSKVRTQDGAATIVFYEGELMHLEPNTEVSLSQVSSKKVTITQETGETWNKITRLSGMTEYAVETPTTVATVRGTAFMLTPEELAVIEGDVSFANDITSIMVGYGFMAGASTMTEEPIPQEMMEHLKQFPSMYVNILKRVREREVRKHSDLLSMAESNGYGITDVLAKLEEVDAGLHDEDELYNKVPVLMKPRAKRTYELTKEIKQMQVAS